MEGARAVTRGRRLRLPPVVVVLAVAAVAVAAGALIALPKLTGSSGSVSNKLASVKIAPEPWQGHAKPKYRSETELQKAAPWDTPSKRTAPGAIDPKTGMPAASAGTNGSYTPPSPAARKRVYTATHPVGGVESALVRIRPPHTGAGTARDDEVRIERAEILDREPRSLERAGQPVGQKHVRGGQQAAEVLATPIGLDVDRDAALAAVADLEDEVDVGTGVLPGEASDDQGPAGVTRLDVLHLDDVGAPIRQRRTGGRHVRPRCELDDAHSAQHFRHCNALPTSCRYLSEPPP